MNERIDFTEGKIVGPLFKFVVPVLFALFLQAMYGAVDLIVVGKFAGTEDVSAVTVGSQIMHTITNFISSLAMGITVFLGQKMGEKDEKAGGKIVGSGIFLFGVLGVVMTVAVPLGASGLATVMKAPAEAFGRTTDYIRICGFGLIVIIAYNLIGSIFRGMGDSKTPLITVLIACICNIAGDLLLVAVFNLGTSGAAIATVFAQLVSVVLSVIMIRKKTLPFKLSKGDIRFHPRTTGRILLLGAPIALQDLLVSFSFLFVTAIVNELGVVASAGVGVAQKVCAFIMLVPLAFMQAMSAFVAQNRGAGKLDRAEKGLRYAIAISTAFGVAMFFLSFFRGDWLAFIFTKDEEVMAAAADYLKAYAIDCLFTCFMFCFIGFFNGMGHTTFVMLQGLIGAFFVRVPVAYLMSKVVPVRLFNIGLATPCSTVMQILICFVYMIYVRKKYIRKR